MGTSTSNPRRIWVTVTYVGLGKFLTIRLVYSADNEHFPGCWPIFGHQSWKSYTEIGSFPASPTRAKLVWVGLTLRCLRFDQLSVPGILRIQFQWHQNMYEYASSTSYPRECNQSTYLIRNFLKRKTFHWTHLENYLKLMEFATSHTSHLFLNLFIYFDLSTTQRTAFPYRLSNMLSHRSLLLQPPFRLRKLWCYPDLCTYAKLLSHLAKL